MDVSFLDIFHICLKSTLFQSVVSYNFCFVQFWRHSSCKNGMTVIGGTHGVKAMEVPMV